MVCDETNDAYGSDVKRRAEILQIVARTLTVVFPKELLGSSQSDLQEKKSIIALVSKYWNWRSSGDYITRLKMSKRCRFGTTREIKGSVVLVTLFLIEDFEKKKKCSNEACADSQETYFGKRLML